MNSPIANNAAAVRAVTGGASKPERGHREDLPRGPVPPADRRRRRSDLTAYVSRVGDPDDAYGDILWAVLNSSEFTLIR